MTDHGPPKEVLDLPSLLRQIRPQARDEEVDTVAAGISESITYCNKAENFEGWVQSKTIITILGVLDNWRQFGLDSDKYTDKRHVYTGERVDPVDKREPCKLTGIAVTDNGRFLDIHIETPTRSGKIHAEICGKFVFPQKAKPLFNKDSQEFKQLQYIARGKTVKEIMDITLQAVGLIDAE